MNLTTALRVQRVASFLLLSTLLQWQSSVLAFRPLQGLWKRPLFSVERTLPPLASIPERPPRGMLSNATMGMGEPSTWTMPYSSRSFTHTNEDNLQVLYTNDPKEINRWLTENLSMEGCTIGFDTESVPNLIGHSKFKGRPVLVQLATTEASIVIPLIHKNQRKYNKACIPLLIQILEDEKIVKCGVGIEGDIHDLMRFVPGMKDLKAKSRLDLALFGTPENQIGLKALTRIVLKRDLEKPKRITISNWSRNPLSEEQIAYSARDAYAGAAIVEELARRDPTTFSTEALVGLLRSQPSVGKVLFRKTRRKNARKDLVRFQKKYKTDESMPMNVKQKVAELKKVLKEAKLELPAMEELGFIRY